MHDRFSYMSVATTSGKSLRLLMPLRKLQDRLNPTERSKSFRVGILHKDQERNQSAYTV